MLTFLFFIGYVAAFSQITYAPNSLSAKEFVDIIFRDLKPAPYLLVRSPTDFLSGCIIDQPDRTMINKLLGFDVDNEIEQIKATILLDDGDRNKNLHMTVRGIGGGKTRVMEEIRRRLLMDPNCYPLAITANLNTQFDGIEFEDTKADNGRRSPTLSIVARMIHSLTLQPFDDILNLMFAYEPYLKKKVLSKQILECVVQQTKNIIHAGGGTVGSLVLILDEAKRIQDSICKMNPLSDDIFSPLRNSLRTPGCALVVASLTPYLSGYTTSGYGARGIHLPGAFDPDAVASEWWGIDKEDPDIYFRFRCMAGLLSSLPRTVEMANTEIERIVDSSARGLSEPGVLSRILKNVHRQVSLRYPTAARLLPSPELMYSAIFGKACEADEAVLDAIESSAFTNSLGFSAMNLVDKKQKKLYILPETNLFLLCKAAERMIQMRTYDLNRALAPVLSAGVNDIITRVVDTGSHIEKEGDLLERLFFPKWLNARIAAAKDARCDITIGELLGLGETTLPQLNCPITLKYNDVDNWTGSLAKSSYMCSHEEFRAHLDTFAVGPNQPLLILRCADADAADYLVIAWERSSTPGNPGIRHHIFVEIKSLAETAKNLDRRLNHGLFTIENFAQLPKGGSQFEQISDAMDGKQPFAYVYHTTNNIKQWKGGHGVPVVYAGIEETERFYGPAMPFYATLHSGG